MIKTEGLKVFYGTQLALNNVDLHIEVGQVTAIVGPSGCGKSSFLSAINRMTDMLPGASVQGKVFFDCCDINAPGYKVTDLRKCVGMIFQRPNPFPMSIEKNIQLALKEHGMRDRTKLQQVTEQVLRDVGLWDEVKDRLGRSALQLSGGQQQRLCIARAIALRPKVLLMDEPCSALDPKASAKVEELILRLRGGYSIAIVTHNLAQARRIADRVAVFWTKDGVGEVIQQGSVADIFENSPNATVRDYVSGLFG